MRSFDYVGSGQTRPDFLARCGGGACHILSCQWFESTRTQHGADERMRECLFAKVIDSCSPRECIQVRLTFLPGISSRPHAVLLLFFYLRRATYTSRWRSRPGRPQGFLGGLFLCFSRLVCAGDDCLNFHKQATRFEDLSGCLKKHKVKPFLILPSGA